MEKEINRNSKDRLFKPSEAFRNDTKGDIEVTVRMLNINYGRNMEHMEQCRPLGDYSNFVDTVRRLKEEGIPTEDAVHMAIRKLGINSPIRKYLLANEAEVSMLVITEYDEKEYGEMCKEEGRVEGEDKLARLITALKEEGRDEEVFKAASDVEFRNKLYKELGIA